MHEGILALGKRLLMIYPHKNHPLTVHDISRPFFFFTVGSFMSYLAKQWFSFLFFKECSLKHNVPTYKYEFRVKGDVVATWLWNVLWRSCSSEQVCSYYISFYGRDQDVIQSWLYCSSKRMTPSWKGFRNMRLDVIIRHPGAVCIWPVWRNCVYFVLWKEARREGQVDKFHVFKRMTEQKKGKPCIHHYCWMLMFIGV